jgi:hypothetical protein
MVSRAELHWAHIGCSLSKVSQKIRTRPYRTIADIVGTEDYFHHQRPAAPATETEAASAAAKERLEAFVKKRMEEDEPAPAATEAAPAPVAAAATAAPVAAVPAV